MEPIGLDDAATRLGFDLISGFCNFLSVVGGLLADLFEVVGVERRSDL